MVVVAVEQSEPPGRRLVDDDLAAQFLPAPTRWLVTATPPNLMRRLTMAAMERQGPGLWAGMTCRKRYIADKVTESLDDIDVVVVLGALPPEEVATFLGGHGWRLAEQAGPDLIMQRYVEPSGRDLTASQVEWSAYAEKT